MSILASITKDGNRYTCGFESFPEMGVIVKTVIADSASQLIAGISEHSKEVDRHVEFFRAKKQGRAHENPKHLWQQQEDPRLFEKISREQVESL
jgi:hypothetical protein